MKSKLDRINRQDISRAVSKKTGISQEIVAKAFDEILEEIKTQFHRNNMIELRGFGTFYPYFKKGRTYTIPRLKEERIMKGRWTLKFKPSKRILLYYEE